MSPVIGNCEFMEGGTRATVDLGHCGMAKAIEVGFWRGKDKDKGTSYRSRELGGTW